MFKTKGGVKGVLNNVQKNCGFGNGGHPLGKLGKFIRKIRKSFAN